LDLINPIVGFLFGVMTVDDTYGRMCSLGELGLGWEAQVGGATITIFHQIGLPKENGWWQIGKSWLLKLPANDISLAPWCHDHLNRIRTTGGMANGRTWSRRFLKKRFEGSFSVICARRNLVIAGIVHRKLVPESWNYLNWLFWIEVIGECTWPNGAAVLETWYTLNPNLTALTAGKTTVA